MSSDNIYNINYNENIIKIKPEVFNDLLDKSTIKIPEYLAKKKTEIYKNYNCFQKNYEYKSFYYDKCKSSIPKHKDSGGKIYTNRLYILSSDFTSKTKNSKTFISFLNKLTIHNKEVIYEKIDYLLKNITIEEIFLSLFDILWGFIKKSFDNIYVDLLYLFEKYYNNSIINTTWDKYIDSKEWYPEAYIMDNNLLSTANNYDEFCDYIKWKKSISNINKTWCYLYIKTDVKKLELLLEIYFDFFIDLINDDNNFKIKKHIIDYILEQVLIILKKYYYKNIINKLKDVCIDKFNNSSKFIIMDILELKSSG